MTTGIIPAMAHPAKDDVFEYERPSDLEKSEYYSGLSGNHCLVARTSTDTWEGAGDWAPLDKCLFTIGKHPIVDIWCPELRQNLVHTLNEAGDGHGGWLDWELFYPIRIGRRMDGVGGDDINDPNYPVVLLVGLRAADMINGHGNPPTWKAALDAALGCRDRLEEYGIIDVEVEVYVSDLSSFALSSPASHQLATELELSLIRTEANEDPTALEPDINSDFMPLLPFPGCRIEQEPAQQPSDAHPRAGTMGVYLRLGVPGEADCADDADGMPGYNPSTGGVYGLTSRHVVVGTRVEACRDIGGHGQADGRVLRVLSAGVHSYNSTIRLLACRGALLGHELNRTGERDSHQFILSTNDGALRIPYSPNERAQAYIAELKAILISERDLINAYNDAVLAERLVGPVAYAPHHHVDARGAFVDWALVRLRDQAPHTDAVRNVVCISSSITAIAVQWALRQEGEHGIYHGHLDVHAPCMNVDGFLKLHGKDIPAHPPFADATRTSLFVAKQGASTNLTFGLTNEIEAVFRTPRESGPPRIACSLAVIGFNGLSFAGPGDSGASVFDMDGCIVGIIDAGEKTNNLAHHFNTAHRTAPEPVNTDTPNSPDIGQVESSATFVTPIQWVMDSVREFTGMEPSIL